MAKKVFKTWEIPVEYHIKGVIRVRATSKRAAKAVLIGGGKGIDAYGLSEPELVGDIEGPDATVTIGEPVEYDDPSNPPKHDTEWS